MILGCSSLATPNLLSLNRARHVRWRCHLEFLPAFEQKRGDLQGDYLDYLAPGALASPEGRASGECYSAATVAGELWFSPKSGNVGVSGNARFAINGPRTPRRPGIGARKELAGKKRDAWGGQIRWHSYILCIINIEYGPQPCYTL